MKFLNVNQMVKQNLSKKIKSERSIQLLSRNDLLLSLVRTVLLVGTLSVCHFAFAQEQNTSTNTSVQVKSSKMKIKAKTTQEAPQVRVLKETLESIRYEKDDLAIASFAIDLQGQRLLGETWNQATEDQKKSFVESFSVIFRKIAFSKIRSNLKYLEDTVIGETQTENGITRQKITLVILHELKKEEIVIHFEMQAIHQTWKIVDIQVEKEDSFVKKIREDQILPILKQDGLDGLIKALKERAGQINAK
jgi:ABC-type transporter MlaC component